MSLGNPLTTMEIEVTGLLRASPSEEWSPVTVVVLRLSRRVLGFNDEYLTPKSLGILVSPSLSDITVSFE